MDAIKTAIEADLAMESSENSSESSDTENEDIEFSEKIKELKEYVSFGLPYPYLALSLRLYCIFE